MIARDATARAGAALRLPLAALLLAAAAPVLLLSCRTANKAKTLRETVAERRGMVTGTPAPNPRAKFLAELHVCLDPGHGGDVGPEFERTKYKRGPTGLREAEVNLRTALALAEMLREAGATVTLTRADDSEVPLEARPRIAKEAGADLLLSIHHNAAGNPTANYSSVWYHGDGVAFPASVDVARALSDSLARTLRLPNADANGIYSDNLMYGPRGFAVLRDARMPSVLAECSFYTNPEEEELLRDPEYNATVARALFDGLADWAANGVPRWELAAWDGATSITLEIDDGMKEGWGALALRVRPGSLSARWNGVPLPVPERPERILPLALPAPPKAGDTLEVRFENNARNASVTPPRVWGETGWRRP